MPQFSFIKKWIHQYKYQLSYKKLNKKETEIEIDLQEGISDINRSSL